VGVGLGWHARLQCGGSLRDGITLGAASEETEYFGSQRQALENLSCCPKRQLFEI
jgi:hypothetical protein